MTDLTANDTTVNATYDYGAYYDDDLEAIAPCNDYELRDFGQVFLPTLYSLVFILGFAGNGLVVLVLVKYRKQTNLTDICLFNLALSDLLFVITLPFYAHYSNITKWIFKDFTCRLMATCHSTGFFSSIFSMVVMTLDRYVVIMHRVRLYRTRMAGVAVIIFVWLLSLSVSLPTAIFTKLSNETVCLYSPDNHAWKVYNVFATSLLGLVIPLLAMVVCYSRIIPVLANMRGDKKHRVVRLIVFIVAAFVLFWAPYNISLFLQFLYSKGRLPSSCSFSKNIRLSIVVTEAFAYTHCCLNPFIYAFVGQRFMQRVKQLLRRWLPGIQQCSTRDFSDSSFRKSSVMSRSSDVSTVIM